MSLRDDLWAEKLAAAGDGDIKRMRVVIRSQKNGYTQTPDQPV